MPIEMPRGLPFAVDTWTPVDRDKNSECHHTLSHVAPEIIADDDASSRFQVIPFPRLSERAMEILALARARGQPEPLIIRPSSQWYAYYEPPEASLQRKPVLTEPMQDEFGVWHVCLSMHSSREELEQALGILRPKWVVSTTPPCMAVDLSYVKRHCSLSRLGPDDPLWKLLRIPDGMSTAAGRPQVALTVEVIDKSSEEFTCSAEGFGSDDSSLLEIAEPTVEEFEIKVEPPVTLFGSARFGLLQSESQLWKDEYENVEVMDDDDVKFEAKHSATEHGLWKDCKPDESVEVIDLTEVPVKDQSSVTESEVLKDSKSDDGAEVVDLTEDERKELSLSIEPELCKDDEGNGEAKLKAQECNLTVHANLREICSHKVTDEGENRMEVTKDISAVQVILSAKINKDPTKDDTAILEMGKNSDQDSERVSNSSTIIGSSKGLNANLRRLYRSINVLVPRPLPSLVELMGTSKRPRVSQTVPL